MKPSRRDKTICLPFESEEQYDVRVRNRKLFIVATAVKSQKGRKRGRKGDQKIQRFRPPSLAMADQTGFDSSSPYPKEPRTPG